MLFCALPWQHTRHGKARTGNRACFRHLRAGHSK